MRITFVGRLDAGIAGGGGEVQLFQTKSALEGLGCRVEIWTPDTASPGDLVHFFGCWPYFDGIARWLRSKNVPYVYSPIFTQSGSVSQMPFKSWRHKHISHKFGKGVAEAIRGSAAVFGTSQWELDKIAAYFGEPLPVRHCMPLGVAPIWEHADEASFRTWSGVTGPYVLSVSRIEPNKGTLTLIKAAQGQPWSLVLLGAELKAKYAAQCRAAAGSNVHFLGTVPHDDSRLAGAYHGCSIFALPTQGETFCLAAAEAIGSGKRVLLGVGWNAEANFAPYCQTFDPTSVSAWRAGIASAMSQPSITASDIEAFREKFSWEGCARSLLSHYERIVSARSH